MREAQGILEQIASNIPTLSQSLPERRDWLGLPIVRKDKDGGFIEGLVQPTRVSEQVSDIVRLEVSALSQGRPRTPHGVPSIRSLQRAEDHPA